MFSAIAAAEGGAKTALIEKNSRLGVKLSITGKGRCNLTNNSPVAEHMENIPRNPKFMYSALSGFDSGAVMRYFEGLGVPLKTERGKRVFPVSDKAGDIVRALSDRLSALGVTIVRGNVRALILENGACVGVRCENKDHRAKSVILATGGKSYPKTGSDGSGYALAKQAGHTVISPEPSLSALTTEKSPLLRASGLTLKNAAVSLYDRDKRIYEDFGELLFTGYGVSGPTVLSASAHIPKPERGRYKLKIDLKPALDEKKLDARIQRDFNERHGTPFSESLRGLLPKELTEPITGLSGIPPEKKVDEVTREERHGLCALLKGLSLEITGFRPIEEAIITRGGVSVKEISPGTMESRLCEGLFFAGEIIDVDAYTGGFNLQIAFSTARAAGIAAALRKDNT